METANINLKVAGGPGAALHGDEPKTAKDLEALSRKYRMMDNGRRAYVEETKKEIRRQLAVIDRLEKEQAQLTERVADATFRAGGTKAKMAEAEGLAQQRQQLEQRVAQEKDAIKGLERKIKAAEKTIDELRKTRAEAERSRPTAEAVEREVKLLENRLQHATTRYNRILADNRALRDEITHLRSEHLAFEKIHSGLRTQLEEKQQEITDLMDHARQEFKRREALQDQLQRLRDTSAKEEAAFEEEWAELGRALERDQRRRALQQQQLEQQRQHLREEMQQHMTQSMRTASPAEGKVDEQGISEQAYEEAFRSILASGCYPEIQLDEGGRLTEEVVHKIVAKYLANEEGNFSLFNYTNELRTEVEQREAELFKLRDELAKAKRRKDEADASLKDELLDLEQQLATVRTTGEAFESQYKELSTAMGDVYRAVEVLFRESGCQPIGGVSRVDENVTEGFVTAENVTIHLAAIESSVDAALAKLLLMVQNGGLPREELQRLLYLDIPQDVRVGLTPASSALLRASKKDEELAYGDF